MANTDSDHYIHMTYLKKKVRLTTTNDVESATRVLTFKSDKFVRIESFNLI
jgi:hypothetical protein